MQLNNSYLLNWGCHGTLDRVLLRPRVIQYSDIPYISKTKTVLHSIIQTNGKLNYFGRSIYNWCDGICDKTSDFICTCVTVQILVLYLYRAATPKNIKLL